ncbi:MAG: hypothetical protein FWC33_01430 [Candidatus Bathyarchaeota archaeon]|nr:hypothetical protein [Candidatus Termiticorpusculum sp.]
MNNFVPFILLFIFISGLFTAVVSPVSVKLIENSWNTKTPMSYARANLGVIAVDGKIYAIGGYTAINHEWWGPYQTGFVGINECYDPKTDTWVTLKPMPTSRANFAIVAYQDKIYCMGGESRSGIHNAVEVYDIATDSWSTKKDILFNGLGIQAHVVDGKIYVVKGQDLYMYNPTVDEWTEKVSMPRTDDIAAGSGVFDFVSVAFDSEIVIYFPCIHN